MKVGIPKEVHPGERRVAGTPETVAKLRKLGFEVLVESEAGAAAAFSDAAYTAVEGQIVATAAELWQTADIVLKVRPVEAAEVAQVRAGQVLVSFVWPAKNEALVQQLAARGATLLAMDQIPRVSRAQKMDALSSMANIAGYRAVIEAAKASGSTLVLIGLVHGDIGQDVGGPEHRDGVS